MLPSNALKILKAFQEATQWQDSGEVVLRYGDETGHVFFARGKIAWATASTLKRTFTTYMVQVAKLDENKLKRLFEECKRTGKNFGETIVEWGLLNELALRQLLLVQIAETVLELLAWPKVESMFVPEHRTYKGSLTFDICEVLQRTIELDSCGRLPFRAASAEQLLEECRKSPAETEGAAPQPPRRRPLAAFAAAGVVLLLAAAGTMLLLRDRLFSPRQASVASLATSGDAEKRDGGATAVTDAGAQVAAGAADSEATEVPGEPDAGPGETRSFPDGIVAFADGEGDGTLRVTSTPTKATIFLDGVSTGKTTPSVLARVPAGREHLVLVDKEGLRPTFVQVTLKKDRTTHVSLAPTARGKAWTGKVVVRVESDPTGSTVILDGNPFSQLTPVDIKLSAAKVSKLVVVHDGYQPWVRKVRPVPEVKLTIFARMEKQK